MFRRLKSLFVIAAVSVFAPCIGHAQTLSVVYDDLVSEDNANVIVEKLIGTAKDEGKGGDTGKKLVECNNQAVAVALGVFTSKSNSSSSDKEFERLQRKFGNATKMNGPDFQSQAFIAVHKEIVAVSKSVATNSTSLGNKKLEDAWGKVLAEFRSHVLLLEETSLLSTHPFSNEGAQFFAGELKRLQSLNESFTEHLKSNSQSSIDAFTQLKQEAVDAASGIADVNARLKSLILMAGPNEDFYALKQIKELVNQIEPGSLIKSFQELANSSDKATNPQLLDQVRIATSLAVAISSRDDQSTDTALIELLRCTLILDYFNKLKSKGDEAKGEVAKAFPVLLQSVEVVVANSSDENAKSAKEELLKIFFIGHYTKPK